MRNRVTILSVLAAFAGAGLAWAQAVAQAPDGTFTCANGATGTGGMLIAVYGKGNSHGKPAGSGWWAVELDKSACAAQAAGLYGCAFDASGASTACGAAVVHDKGDALVVTASR